MVSKPKVSTAPVSTPSSTSAPVAGKAKPATSAASASTVPAVGASTASAASVTPASTAAPVASRASSLATGPEYEAAVSNIVEMGFSRETVQQAMKAAFNNPERAVEYLMQGIPDNAEMLPQEAGEGEDGGEEMDDVADLDPNAFAALSQNPQLQQLRQLVQSQPQLLEPILQQLGQSSPQLLQLISQNPGAFMSWISGEDEGGAEGATEGQARMPAATQIQLTQAELDAVNRLAALGFDKRLALEAYLACDKNEELAANYLFDNSGDFQ